MINQIIQISTQAKRRTIDLTNNCTCFSRFFLHFAKSYGVFERPSPSSRPKTACCTSTLQPPEVWELRSSTSTTSTNPPDQRNKTQNDSRFSQDKLGCGFSAELGFASQAARLLTERAYARLPGEFFKYGGEPMA